MSSIVSIFEKLNKIHGTDSVFDASSNAYPKTEAISTGSYLLDDLTGIGGVPRGRLSQFAGAPASGKTFMALQVVKSWQQQHPENWAFWVDAEFSFNTEWAERLGVDPARVRFKRENDGQKIFDYLCGVPDSKNPGKKAKAGLLDELLAIKHERLGVLVIDSIAAMIPPVEASQSVGKQNMSPMARFMPAACRRIAPLAEKLKIAVIGINQVRVDPSVMYGNPETSPGGGAWKHHCRLMCNFAQVMRKDEMILNEKEVQIGHKIKIRTDKNSFALRGQTSIAIKYLEGVAFTNVEMVELALAYGVIQRPSNIMYTYKDQKWKGREAMDTALLDVSLFNEIHEEVKAARAAGKSSGLAGNVNESGIEADDDTAEDVIPNDVETL